MMGSKFIDLGCYELYHLGKDGVEHSFLKDIHIHHDQVYVGRPTNWI